MFGYQPTMGHAGEWYYNEAWFNKISGYEKPSVEAFAPTSERLWNRGSPALPGGIRL